MRRLRIASILAGAIALAVIGAGFASASGQPLMAGLDGASEVPGPGDPDGSGHAAITVNRGLGEICWWLEVEGIAPATAAHIHIGDPTVAGPVVVPLTPPTEGTSSGCASVDRELAKAIGKEPGAYYVNVHNTDFPAGALRGQLG